MLVCLFYSNAFADDGFYVSIGGGIEKQEDTHYKLFIFPGKYEYSDGHVFSSRFGYMFDFFRLEAEFLQSKNNLETLSLNETSYKASGVMKTRELMINAYYCYKNFTNLLPYISIGYGKSRVSMDDITNVTFAAKIADEKTNTSTFQMKLGLIYKINSNFQFSIGLRWLRTSHMSFTDLSSDETISMNGLRQEMIETGVQYNF